MNLETHSKTQNFGFRIVSAKAQLSRRRARMGFRIEIQHKNLQFFFVSIKNVVTFRWVGLGFASRPLERENRQIVNSLPPSDCD